MEKRCCLVFDVIETSKEFVMHLQQCKATYSESTVTDDILSHFSFQKPKDRFLSFLVGCIILLLNIILVGLWSPFAQAQIEFEEVTQDAGISYIGKSWGASWGDFNGDGWPDLWIGNHDNSPLLILNNIDGTFTDFTHIVTGYCDYADMHGAAWADFDNDGDQDLIQLVGSTGANANQFFINSEGILQNKAIEYGLNYSNASGRTPLWFDWNGDGYLDVLFANYVREDLQIPSALFTQQDENFTNDDALTGFSTYRHNLYAQLTHLTDQNIPVIVLNGIWSSNYPDRIYQYKSLPFLDMTDTLNFPRIPSVFDTAIADFDNNLLPDFYLARLTNISSVAQTDSTKIRTWIRVIGDEKGILFQAEGNVHFQINPYGTSALIIYTLVRRALIQRRTNSQFPLQTMMLPEFLTMHLVSTSEYL
jgi:hypothetical protein